MEDIPKLFLLCVWIMQTIITAIGLYKNMRSRNEKDVEHKKIVEKQDNIITELFNEIRTISVSNKEVMKEILKEHSGLTEDLKIRLRQFEMNVDIRFKNEEDRFKQLESDYYALRKDVNKCFEKIENIRNKY